MARILIVDDDVSFRDSLVETFASLGHDVATSGDGSDALAMLALRSFDLAIVDQRMPGLSGLELLAAIKADAHLASLPVLLLTAYADAENTIDAMKLGAFDHLAKPIGRADIVDVLARALPPALPRELAGAERDGMRPTPEMIGSGPVMRAVQKLVGIAAASQATVLIQGETGTGKELVARAIHAHSDRGMALPATPFVALNCAAIPADLLESELFGHERGAFSGALQARDGRFREAHGGTLFLDEIGDMSLAMQAKLLRVLQDRIVTPIGGSASKPVDVRVLAATHRDLVAMVEAGRFREDLFYRLNVLRIELPPLRERGSDILALAERLIERYAPTPKRLTAAASRALLAYRWPGNVRELENLMQKVALVVRGAVVDESDLQLAPPGPTATASSIEDWLSLDFATATGRFEKLLIERALADSQQNRSAAARRLGIHRQLLYTKLKEHGID